MKHTEYACEVDYDRQFDFLSFTRPKVKSTGSIVAGPFTIDLHKNELAGIEIEHARSLLESLFGRSMDLRKILNPRIGFQEKSNVLVLFLTFEYEKETLEQKVVVTRSHTAPILA